MSKKTEMLKVIVSGSYMFKLGKHNAESVQFSGVEGELPRPFDERKVLSYVRFRLLPMWITGNKDYKKHYMRAEEVFIEDVTPLEKINPVYDEDIKEMDWEKLQFLAITMNIKLPQYRQCQLKEARRKAYVSYAENILGIEDFTKLVKDPYEEWPSLFVSRDHTPAPSVDAISNAKLLGMEPEPVNPLIQIAKIQAGEAAPERKQDVKTVKKQGGDTVAQKMDMKELKETADALGIDYKKNISYDKLAGLVEEAMG